MSKTSEELLKEYLLFRKQFTNSQWNQINQSIQAYVNQKVDETTLDDQDVEILSDRLLKNKFIW